MDKLLPKQRAKNEVSLSMKSSRTRRPPPRRRRRCRRDGSKRLLKQMRGLRWCYPVVE